MSRSGSVCCTTDRRLLGELAAVEEEQAAVEARSGAVQPERSGGDLVGSAEPAERDGLHGVCLVECAGGDHVADHRGVDGARQTALIRTPCGPYSLAALLVSPMTACLEARYGARPGPPIRPPMEEQFTMEPAPWMRIWRSSCFMLAHTPW